MIENRIEELKYIIHDVEIMKNYIETIREMIANGELTKENDPDIIEYYNVRKNTNYDELLNKHRKELKELEVMIKVERLNEDFKFDSDIDDYK